jgi:hypothetical protein
MSTMACAAALLACSPLLAAAISVATPAPPGVYWISNPNLAGETVTIAGRCAHLSPCNMTTEALTGLLHAPLSSLVSCPAPICPRGASLPTTPTKRTLARTHTHTYSNMRSTCSCTRTCTQSKHARTRARICSFDGSETVEICTDAQSTDDCTAVASVDVWAHSTKFVMPSDRKSGPRWIHIKSATGGGAATVTPINTPDVRCNAVECSMLHGARRPSLACWAPRSFHAPSHLSLFMAPTHCVSYVDCVGEPFLPHWPTRAGHGRSASPIVLDDTP